MNPGDRKSKKKPCCYFVSIAGTALFWLLFVGSSGVENVHYVDSMGSNYLFRGSEPLNDQDEFDYNGLQAAIISAGKEANISVPEVFYLLDINLLNLENSHDLKKIQKEFKFFKDHYDLGQLEVRETIGTTASPMNQSFKLDNPFRQYLEQNVDNWLTDPLVTRVDMLREWLRNPKSQLSMNKPIVIYVHCFSGCDRTGELIGAYYLRYMNGSWEEMNEINYDYCGGRPFGCNNYWATQWYCLWLNQEYGTALNCSAEFPCTLIGPRGPLVNISHQGQESRTLFLNSKNNS